MSIISGSWEEALREEFKKTYYKELYCFIKSEYDTKQIFPPANELFSAFHLTALEDVKVVILGQDPYHNEGQAHGLSFSVKPGIKIPPSLLNIYKELHTDIGSYIPDNGYLVKWAKQGVFLLNSVLSVEAHKATSHSGKGWERFTDSVIEVLNKEDRPMVFLLWGRFAVKKASMLNNPRHLVLKAAHPSPLSAYNGFFGCKHFSKTNDFLAKNGLKTIDWQIDNLRG